MPRPVPNGPVQNNVNAPCQPHLQWREGQELVPVAKRHDLGTGVGTQDAFGEVIDDLGLRDAVLLTAVHRRLDGACTPFM